MIRGGVDPHLLRFISERIDPPGSIAAQGLQFLADIIDSQNLRFWSIPDQRLDPFSELIYFGSRAVQYRVLGLYRANGLIRSPFPIRTGSKDGSARRLAGIVFSGPKFEARFASKTVRHFPVRNKMPGTVDVL